MSTFIDMIANNWKPILQDMVTPDRDMSNQKISERAVDRNDAMKSVNGIMSKYNNTIDADGNLIEDPNFQQLKWIDANGDEHNGVEDLQSVLDGQELLEGELELSYDELAHDSNFLVQAKKMYKAEHGHNYKGNAEALVEDTFKKFNWMEFNVGWTGIKLISDSMFYDDFDQDGLEATANAYEIFKETNWTGDGSRAFQKQALDLGKSTVGDPLGWAMFSRKLLLLGSNTAKLAAKGIFQKTITDRMSAMIAASAYTASYSAAMSANIQTAEMDMGLRDSLHKGELAIATGLGAALPPAINLVGGAGVAITNKISNILAKYTPVQNFSIPFISSDASQAIGNVQRSVLHPHQAYYGRNMLDEDAGTMKGKTSALVGVMSNLRDAAIAKSSKQSIKEFMQSLNDHVVTPMSQSIKRGYDSLKYRDITEGDVKPINEALTKVLELEKNNTKFNDIINSPAIQDLLKLIDAKSPQSADEFAEILAAYQTREALAYKKWKEAAGSPYQPPVYVKEKPPVRPEAEFLKATTTNEAGETVATKDISEVFKKLRQVLYQQSKNAFTSGDAATGQALKEFRLVISSAQRNQLSSKGDKQLYDSLVKSSEDYKNILKKTTIGRHFATILQRHKDAVYNRSKKNPEGQFDPSNELALGLDKETDIAVKNLLEDIIDDKNSLPKLLQFQNVLNALDYRTNRINNTINLKNNLADLEVNMFKQLVSKDFTQHKELEQFVNLSPIEKDRAIKKLATEKLSTSELDSYPALLEIIKSRFGENLRTDMASDSGLVYLGKVLDREDGFELVSHIYPEFKGELNKIKSLDDFLKNKVLKKHSQSVIVNMTFASLAMEAGLMAGGGGMAGKVLAGGATLTTMGGLQGWRNLVGNPKFQQHMVNILNNDGRISTKTASKLYDQFGFDDAGIRQLQDDLNNMLITVPIIKTQDDLRDSAKKMMQ